VKRKLTNHTHIPREGKERARGERKAQEPRATSWLHTRTTSQSSERDNSLLGTAREVEQGEEEVETKRVPIGRQINNNAAC